jgi:hypothetical protein
LFLKQSVGELACQNCPTPESAHRRCPVLGYLGHSVDVIELVTSASSTAQFVLGDVMHQLQPTVWQWYLQRDTGLRFEVIDVDDEEQIIEVQDEDGVLSHIDLDAWFHEPLEETEEPQEYLIMSNGLFDPEDEALIEANAASSDLRNFDETEHRAH